MQFEMLANKEINGREVIKTEESVICLGELYIIPESRRSFYRGLRQTRDLVDLCSSLRSRYLRCCNCQEECNVICVDWEAGAVIPNYVRAAANTRLVGKQLSMLLAGLNKHIGLPIHNVHVIGFSLGAHVAGFAGAELKNLSRITGLDPAAPLFESQDPKVRLDSSDAMFVDVIHSNGENLILGGLGSWQPMGDVDFYPNGGRMQKGCTNLFVGAVTDILWSASDVEGRSLCNHRRAYKFFTDSVSPRCHFPSFPCESYDKFLEGDCFPCNGERRCGNMGYYADRSNGRGTLFLITREEEPFCAHQYHVRVESSLHPEPLTSYGKIQLTLIGNSEINETFPLTQKDDEELKMGSSLARIAVPHPVLQEPKSVQIMYTAYSGWISSGLSSWSIDKVTLTDSFGKSMSVCKKGLVLESGIPVNLPLYPGECNPPRDNLLDDKDNWTISSSTPSPTNESEKKEQLKQSLGLLSLNATDKLEKFTLTPIVKIGDEFINKEAILKTTQIGDIKQDRATLLDAAEPVTPQPLESLPWQPIDFLDNSNSNSLEGTHNKRENSRSFNTHITNVILHNQTLGSGVDMEISTDTNSTQEENSSSSTEASPIRHEIKEPVLTPTSTSHPASWPREVEDSGKDALTINSTSEAHQGKPEITEPVLNPKTTTSTPRPSVVKTREIAAGSYQNDEKTNWMPSVDLNPPPIGGVQTWQHWVTETATTTTKTPVIEDKSYDVSPSTNETNGEGRRLSVSPTNKIIKKSNSSPLTVQFFPQRLAAILAQAERYARLTFSLPMAAISKLGYYKSTDASDSDQITSASSNRLYTLNSQIVTGIQDDRGRRNPGAQTQRRPKHFTTTRPSISNVNTKQNNHPTPSTFHNFKGESTTEVSGTSHVKKDIFQPRIDSVGNSPHVKDTTPNLNIFVPYTYTYVTHENQEGSHNIEMPRYIPLLRYPNTADKNENVQQTNNKSNSNDQRAANNSNKQYNKVKDVKEAVECSDGSADISIALDGTWQKRDIPLFMVLLLQHL
ncbi:hypothetical protein ANN_01751 [Periplaneta americana]|uniref:Lipase domain-containing protein n=1 Tax=Periplaneta americana TaxID=6978 RepID=A0ABQ8TWT1_PERAM|nr:hypothetical protein ANN_01751 [Periplaneta americana]